MRLPFENLEMVYWCAKAECHLWFGDELPDDLRCPRCGNTSWDRPHTVTKLVCATPCGRAVVEATLDLPTSQIHYTSLGHKTALVGTEWSREESRYRSGLFIMTINDAGQSETDCPYCDRTVKIDRAAVAAIRRGDRSHVLPVSSGRERPRHAR